MVFFATFRTRLRCIKTHYVKDFIGHILANEPITFERRSGSPNFRITIVPLCAPGCVFCLTFPKDVLGRSLEEQRHDRLTTRTGELFAKVSSETLKSLIKFPPVDFGMFVFQSTLERNKM